MGSSDWASKRPYSHMWVGTSGRRTVGQQAGYLEDGSCTGVPAVGGSAGGAAPSPPDGAPACFGWAPHNKPVVTQNSELATGLTAIVHVSMGRVLPHPPTRPPRPSPPALRPTPPATAPAPPAPLAASTILAPPQVNRIVWDSSCNLCSSSADPLGPRCNPDRTDILCEPTGDPGCPNCCRDCYAPLKPDSCTGSTEICSPKARSTPSPLTESAHTSPLRPFSGPMRTDRRVPRPAARSTSRGLAPTCTASPC